MGKQAGGRFGAVRHHKDGETWSTTRLTFPSDLGQVATVLRKGVYVGVVASARPLCSATPWRR